LVKRRATRDTALASALAVVICFSKMQLQVGKTYRVKAADTLKIRKPAARGDWSQIDPAYLKPGDMVYVEEVRRTTGGSAYWVSAGNASGVLHYDCGVNLSEFLELVG
jgi:hypothetical protein